MSVATATGLLTVTTTDYLYPGALAWVTKDDGSAMARVKILAIIGTTQVQVRRFANDSEFSNPGVLGGPSYGRSDMTAFDGGGVHICQEAQNVPVDPAYSKRVVP